VRASALSLSLSLYVCTENVHKVETSANANDEEVLAACGKQEAALNECGGLDLLLLGVSSSGRLAFHEPDFSPPEGAQVAFVELDNRTRVSAASDFFGMESVPTHAVTISTFPPPLVRDTPKSSVRVLPTSPAPADADGTIGAYDNNSSECNLEGQ
jgi:hypothetical protein